MVGALIGAIGLFTWQRSDWVAKQQYLRAQVLLDRRLQLVEQINTDVGMLVARADSVVAIIGKQPQGTQRAQVIEDYNEEQAAWFGTVVSLQAFLDFYFPPTVAERFAEEIVEATKALDVAICRYSKENTAANQEKAIEVSQAVRNHLQAWNEQAFEELQTK